MRPWDGIITDEDRRAYDAAGFGRSAGMGRRPALLIIDVQYRTTGSLPLPFWQAVEEYPTSCGEVGWKASVMLGARARSHNVCCTNQSNGFAITA